MSLVSITGYSAQAAGGGGGPQNLASLLDDRGAISFWPLSQPSSPFADTKGHADLVASGAGTLQFIEQTLVDDGSLVRCIALDGALTLRGTNPGSKPWDATSGAIGVFIQPDQVATKMNLVNRGDGATLAGIMSLEINAGGQERAFRFYDTDLFVELLGTGGNIVPGNSYLLMMSWGGAGLKLYRDATLVDVDNSITSWPVDGTLNSDLFVGRWPNGTTPYNGCLAAVFVLGQQPTDEEQADLALAISLALAEDLDAGTVTTSGVKTVSFGAQGMHFATPVTPVIDTPSGGVGSCGTLAVNGEELEYTAGGSAGGPDAFTYHLVSATGAVSPAQALQIRVALSGATFTGPTTLQSAKAGDNLTSVGRVAIESQEPI